MMKSVTVYCSSSAAVPPLYFDAATAVGRALASNNWTLIYGGNAVGLMKAVADATRAAGGRVVGVTPKLMVDKGISDTLADELVVTNTMRDRKALMEERGDAFLTLPGGLGTFEEVFEIIVGKQLGYHAKPIALLNVAGYFDPLLAMIEHGIEHRFIKPKVRELYFVSAEVPAVVEHFKSYRPSVLADKWGKDDVPSGTE
jgi:uncharacterized protein (TIGR00730 family)